MIKIFLEKKRWHIWFVNAYFVDYIGCLNIHETHVTANNSTYNNIVFFFVSDLKTTINPWPQCIGQEGKKYFSSLPIWRQKSLKTVSKQMPPINMIMIYYWEKTFKKS